MRGIYVAVIIQRGQDIGPSLRIPYSMRLGSFIGGTVGPMVQVSIINA
jgi:hypothetical protein